MTREMIVDEAREVSIEPYGASIHPTGNKVCMYAFIHADTTKPPIKKFKQNIPIRLLHGFPCPRLPTVVPPLHRQPRDNTHPPFY